MIVSTPAGKVVRYQSESADYNQRFAAAVRARCEIIDWAKLQLGRKFTD